MTWTGSDEARKYGTRGGASKKAAERYLIEGEYVTTTEIGQRLNLHPATAHSRLRKAQRAPGAVTWAALRGEA